MRNRKGIMLLIILLAIGFAGVATTLLMSGNVFIGTNESDYKIYFSEAILDDKDKTNSIISANKQVINFETKELTEIGDESVLSFEVTNDSRQYDAEVKFNCQANDSRIFDYVDIDYKINDSIILAKSKTNGSVKATMKKVYVGEEFDKSITCEISTDALEKEKINDTILKEKEYFTYGYLLNEDTPLSNALVVVYSDTPHYFQTDVRGMYLIQGLEGGDHELYVIENRTLDEVKTLTKDEVKNLANDSTMFNTRDTEINLSKYENKYAKVKEGIPETRTATLEVNGGVGSNLSITLINGEQVGYLPTINHDSLLFKGWEVNGNEIQETDIVTDETTLVANYKTGVAAVNGKNFKTLEDAYDYVTTDTEATIDLLEDTVLAGTLENTKNIILNMNEKSINLDKYKIVNNQKLTIKNGTLRTTSSYVLENSGNLSLSNNLSIEHDNTTNVSEAIKTILNKENAVLNISNSTIKTNFSSFVKEQSMISNYGEINVVDSEFYADDSDIFIYDGAVFNTNNSTYNINGTFETGNLFQIYGTLICDNSTFRVLEDNVTRKGIFNLKEGGQIELNSGVFDNTYGKGNSVYSYAGSTINLGSKDQTINFIGNATNNYVISHYGDLNIIDGTVDVSNASYFIASFGLLTVGTDKSIPTINGGTGTSIIEVRTKGDNQNSRIINANINVFNAIGINVYKDVKLTIDNATITQENETSTNRIFDITGHLTINNGLFKIGSNNVKGQGIITLRALATLDLNSGTLDNTYGVGNSIYVYANSTFNVGRNNETVNLIGNGTSSYTLYTRGDLNILDGTINVSNGHFIGSYGSLTVGTNSTTPTINGAKGSILLEIRSTGDNQNNEIINANINMLNVIGINVYKDAELIIDNATVIQENETSTNRALKVTGHLIINNGTFKIGENNLKSNGLILVNTDGVLDLNSATLDNTYGKGAVISASAGSTFNMGRENSIVNLTGAKGYFIISNAGNMNINDGTINALNSSLVTSSGLLKIGTDTSIPTLNGAKSSGVITIKSNQDNRIVNANINGRNATVINVSTGAKLTIDNATLTQENETALNRSFDISGELTINNGNYTSSGTGNTSYGLFDIRMGGVLNIDGGSYDYLEADSNLIYTAVDGTVNIGKSLKSSITMYSNSPHPLIATHGNLNIYAGTLTSNSSNVILQSMGDDGETFTEEETLAYRAKINIYGGKLIAESSSPIIHVSAGRIEMNDGEIINNSTGYTIYNKGGTAIQRGGVSAKNFGVTVE